MSATAQTHAVRPPASLVRQGVRDMTPMVIGVVPFGIAIGATVAASSLDPWAGLASAPVILAGAAQLATVQLLDAGATPLVIVVSALIINLRLLLYSASLARWFADAPLRHRLLLAIPVIDQTYFVCTPRFERGDLDLRGRCAYYLGAGGWLITAWLGSQFLAALAGANLPDAARLDMAAPLALVGLLAKSVGTRPALAAAALAAGIAAVGAGLPSQSSTLIATLLAIVIASRLVRRVGAADMEASS